jgi:malonyl CoA-acyl carrier protein transacylase
MIDALLMRCLVMGITRNSLYDLVAQCILELSHETGQRYITLIEEPEQDDPEVIVMVVENESNTCFHMAITGINTDIDNAKAVCSQAVLYRSSEDDPDLYYSVYDSPTQMVFFCLCSPSKQEFGDMACYSMHREASKVAQWLKTYIVSNAEVLRG